MSCTARHQRFRSLCPGVHLSWIFLFWYINKIFIKQNCKTEVNNRPQIDIFSLKFHIYTCKQPCLSTIKPCHYTYRPPPPLGAMGVTLAHTISQWQCRILKTGVQLGTSSTQTVVLSVSVTLTSSHKMFRRWLQLGLRYLRELHEKHSDLPLAP